MISFRPFAGSLALLLAALPLAAQKPAELADRIERGSAASSLDVDGMKPWHLKLAVQLFDVQGKPTEDGSIEEWFLRPGTQRIVYTLPSYNATELVLDHKAYRSGNTSTAPLMLGVLLDQAVHPMPQSFEVQGSTPRLIKTKLGKVPLECVMLDQPIKGQDPLPLGLFPTYCMDPGQDGLRVSYEYGNQMTLRDAEATFQGKRLATVIGVKLNSVQAAKAQVVALGTQPLTAADFTPSADIEAESQETATVEASVMAGHLIFKPPLTRPKSASQTGASGKVVFSAIIGRDGRIRSLRLLQSPDGDLAVAALITFRQYRFSPYLVNGQPTAVATTLTANYFSGTER